MTQITGKKIKITDMMKTAMIGTLNGLKKYNLSIEKEHVIVKHNAHGKDDINIEFVLTIKKHDTIIINESGSDFYVTLGKVGEKADKAIRRMREKDKTTKRRKIKDNYEKEEFTEMDEEELYEAI